MTQPQDTDRKLEVAVHFVCPDGLIWPELRGADIPEIEPDSISKRYRGIYDSWVQRTFYELKRAGLEVTLSPSMKLGAINLIATETLGRRSRTLRSFVVSIRGDFHESQLANFTIEQNFQNDGAPNIAGILHWPEAGIVPRDPSRGSRVERIVFKGEAYNLDVAFRSERFLSALRAMGMELIVDSRDRETGEQNWNDYSEVDVIIAVRNLTEADAVIKPASKLVNAWIGGVPALLGPEPAFRELRRSEIDYFEVAGAEDALAILDRLRSDANLYQATLTNARARAAEFSTEHMIDRWVRLLNGPVLDAFRQWQQTVLPVNASRVLLGLLREPGARKRHLEAFNTGQRILDTPRPPSVRND